MAQLAEILSTIDSHIGGSSWFVFLLLGTGLFFTFYLKFPQIRYFAHAIRCASGKYDKDSDEGDTSHFQALATALSGTIGTGNIGGVALAIHLGGPAALFWMWLTAFLGMTSKFVEVTLSHKYREKDSNGQIAGGPMYYMKNRLNWKWMSIIFAAATVISSFGTGNLPQINSISNSIFATFGIDHKITGFVLSILLAAVILGGISRISKVTEKLVPIMAIFYFLGGLSVILYNAGNIIPSFIQIFSDVFTGTAATGGFLGATFSYAFNRGVNRGLFSNEAGQGSAPIAHAAARAHEPVSEGVVAILEPFIDTIIICTLTGLILLASGAWKEKVRNTFQFTDMEIISKQLSDNNQTDRQLLRQHILETKSLPLFSGKVVLQDGELENKELSIIHSRSLAEKVQFFKGEKPFTGTLKIHEGKVDLTNNEDLVVTGKSLLHSAPLTTYAFTKGFFGDWGQYIVSIGLLLFAFSTVISWSYYGDRAMTFLFGTKSVFYFRIAYVIGFFLASFTDTTIVWIFSGIAIACMTIPNLIGILFLHKDMKETVSDYWKQFKEENP